MKQLVSLYNVIALWIANECMCLDCMPIYFHNAHEHASLHTGLFRDYLHSGYPYVTPSVTFAPGSLSSSVFNVIAISNNAFDPAWTEEIYCWI